MILLASCGPDDRREDRAYIDRLKPFLLKSGIEPEMIYRLEDRMDPCHPLRGYRFVGIMGQIQVSGTVCVRVEE